MQSTIRLSSWSRWYLACLLGLSLTLLSSCSLLKGLKPADPQKPLKREMRAAWLPTIFRSEYAKLSRDEARELLTKRIDLLHRLGCNALIFQVRAEGDAWYPSELEPWSKYFTGKQGKAPSEPWDPLGFVLQACHERGMELHAWMNPYRGASSARAALAPEHPARRYPELYIQYGGQLVMDPGNPRSVSYITRVVKDLVSRYDIDALHFDDYFYPYPKEGESFDDAESFDSYGLTAGYRPEDKAAWRRDNVNKLIYQVRQTLLETKPWVRFGISPFGIYRNAPNYAYGSKTAGLQAYDDLSADVLLWAREGWIDYVVPQVYWNVDHKVADYAVLVPWWGRHLPAKTQLYIGQHVARTMEGKQLGLKLELSRRFAQGNVWWPAEDLLRNVGGISDSLRTSYQRYRALLPEYKGALGRTPAPQPLPDLWEDRNEDGHMLLWDDLHKENDPETPFYYAVYAFPEGVKVDLRDPRYLMSVSTNPSYVLPMGLRGTRYTFAVTAINRFWQESKPRILQVRL